MGDRMGTLEERLDSFGQALGGGEPGLPRIGAGEAASGALGSGGGGASAAPRAPEAFMRAVAARRLSIIGVWSGAVLGVIGVVALIVTLALSVPEPEPDPPGPPPPQRDDEPTFWNLRPGVENPSALERIGGPQESSRPMGGSIGEASIGVRPGSWPADMSPR